MKNSLGLLSAVGAFILWGLLPIYWKQLDGVPSFEVLCHRMVWSLVLTGGLILLFGRGRRLLKELKDIKHVKYFFVSSVLLGGNWLLYIWAVNSNYIIETSLGYFINPLINVLLGCLIFGERLRRAQVGALFFAFVGVLYLTIYYGQFPWIALTLAISFAIYGVVHKKTPIASLDCLCIETILLVLPALVYLVYLEIVGSGHFFSAGSTTAFYLFGTGLATSAPLLLFGVAAHNLRFSTLGLCQYIAPTLALLIGIFLYNEDFSKERMIGFVFIWLGLFLYMGENLYIRYKQRYQTLK